MAACPKCGVENSEGAERCAKCGATLAPRAAAAAVGSQGIEPESRGGETTCVRVFRGPTAQMEADLAKNVLEQEGILCALPGEMAAEVLPGVDIVQLWVRQEDADEATEILKDYFDSPGLVPPEETPA